jgi:hypothetical protein
LLPSRHESITYHLTQSNTDVRRKKMRGLTDRALAQPSRKLLSALLRWSLSLEYWTVVNLQYRNKHNVSRVMQATNNKQVGISALFGCLLFLFSLKMEAVCSSETSVNFYRSTGRHIPEGNAPHLRSTVYIFIMYPGILGLEINSRSMLFIPFSATLKRIKKH